MSYIFQQLFVIRIINVGSVAKRVKGPWRHSHNCMIMVQLQLRCIALLRPWLRRFTTIILIQAKQQMNREVSQRINRKIRKSTTPISE